MKLIIQKPYSIFANIYDDIMSVVNYEKWLTYILALIKYYQHPTETIIDLACGTGNMSFLLAKRGFKVLGIDKSAAMLEIAKSKQDNKSRYPEFKYGDMLDFRIAEKYDLLICLYDSINYLLNEEELSKAFMAINKALRPGGLFIFDFNTCHRIKKIKKDTRLFEGPNYNCFWRDDIDYERCLWQVELELFLKHEETYHYYKEIHQEKGYSINTMATLLNKIPFEVLDFFNAYTFQKATENNPRVYGICRSL